MSDQESQGVTVEIPQGTGTGEDAPQKVRERTPGKKWGGNRVAKRALVDSPESKEARNKIKEKRGHMALRNNVYDVKLELWHILKPLEYYLVDIIIDKTIKWREKESKITIQEFMERTRLTRHTHIYEALKSLEEKKIIFRRKQNHNLIIGLNEEYFGGLLIKRHEDALLARKNKIKIVVDNSKSDVDNSKKDVNYVSRSRTRVVPNSDKVVPRLGQHMSETGTKVDSQDIEIIGENMSLNTLLKDISLKTSLQRDEIGKNGDCGGEKLDPVHGEGEIPEEGHRRRVMEQVQALKAGRLVL